MESILGLQDAAAHYIIRDPHLMMQPELILASQSPRRRKLLEEAGYHFRVIPPRESAECGVCSQETPPEMVARLAHQKAKDVALREDRGVIIGCDTVVECNAHILGKPADLQHARRMLHLLRGRLHHVYSGICLWRRPENRILVRVDSTRLHMDAIADQQLESYLQSGAWRGKAGAFGYQDRLGWVRITQGSPSNVVGLPLELLAEMLRELSRP